MSKFLCGRCFTWQDHPEGHRSCNPMPPPPYPPQQESTGRDPRLFTAGDIRLAGALGFGAGTFAVFVLIHLI